MGDYKFSVNASVGSVSSVEFPVSTASNSSLYFTTPSSVSDSVPSLQHSSSMQDDLLIEKSSGKVQLSSQNSDLNGDHSLKSKDEDGSLGVQADKHNDQSQLGTVVSAPLQLPTGYNVSEPSLNVINSSNPSTASLWSSGPIDDALMQSLNVGPTVNGTLAFQNFPPTNPNALYNTSLGPQMSGLPQTQVQPPQQRRAITASHNFPHNLSRHIQQQNHPQNMYMANKGYTSWSSPQQNTWSQGPQNQANMTGLSPWNRGRSVPNLNPLQQMANRKPSPTFNHHSGMVISPKFRRSTSYPGKGLFPQPPTFEITNMDENREMLLPYQERTMGNANGTSPLDNMRNLEHYLSDIMRGTTDTPDHHLKGFINCNTNALQSLAQLHGKSPFFPSLEDQAALLEDPHLVDGQVMAAPPPPLSSPSRSSPHSQGSETGERFSRKVFVGGLPPDIDEDEITASFRRFGPLVVDWPHKAESKSYFPPKGYAFLLFQDESSVQQLIDACIQDEDKLYLCVSSPTIKDKPVQIRPWRLSDADFVLDASMPLDPRKTVFVGGVPRPLKAVELAMIMDRLYGGVCYAGIDTDPELKYPKGAGRVAFSNQQSYIAAISARFVQLQHGDIDKRVEVKPYVLDDQMCDECQGQRCGGKFAPFFCANVTCLQYYCEHCWATIHSRPGREFHKPLVKEGADRPRAVPFRWC
uniref:RRM domain-containing protein n=1 Tax=Graphocephala atropunctata TaxID=36148 RepID=A0A1B6L4N0_9HEMI